MPYKDPEKARAAYRRWYQRNRSKVIATVRKRKRANRERENAYCRSYYERNREECCRRATERRLANPERHREYRLRTYYRYHEKEKAARLERRAENVERDRKVCRQFYWKREGSNALLLTAAEELYWLKRELKGDDRHVENAGLGTNFDQHRNGFGIARPR